VATGELVLSTRKRDNFFSEEMWRNAAFHYGVSVEALSQDSWDLIVDGAWKVAQDRPAGRISSSSRPSAAQLPKADERGTLLEETEGVHVEGDEEVDWDASAVEVCEFSFHYEC
jgi:hypothetical protein